MSPEGIYRLLLRAYPPDFRGQYEREMVLLFRDQRRESDVRSVGFWAAVIYDVARSAPALRVEAWRQSTRTAEVIMKLPAVLALFVGVFGLLNSVIEWSAGGIGTTEHGVALVLGVSAAALLLAAGGAILRPTERGRQTGRLAVLASLVLIVAARLLHPWMSPFSQLVGFGLPVALLIALYRPRKPSTFTAASIALALVVGLSAPAATQATPVKDLPLTPVQRQVFVGSYFVTQPRAGGSVVRIFEENGVLKANSEAEGETRRLLYQGDAVFRFGGMPEFVLTFVVEGGRATKFTGRKPELEGVMDGVRIQ